MATVGEVRIWRMKNLMPRRWRAPRPPTPRWRSLLNSEKVADVPPMPALSFFDPDTPLTPTMPTESPTYEQAWPLVMVEGPNDNDRYDNHGGDALMRVDTYATDDTDEVDTLSQLGSGTLTPWHSPMSFAEERDSEDDEFKTTGRMSDFIPLEVTLPSPMFSPRWMLPRSPPPCPSLVQSPSSPKSSMLQSHISSISTSSTISSISLSASSCSTAPTSRCPSTCETEMELQIPGPFKVKTVGWDMDSPVRLHFGGNRRDSGALRASIIERRLGLGDDGEGNENRKRLGISVELVRRATKRREQVAVQGAV